MKKYIILSFLAVAGFLTSCDDTTEGLGYSLIDISDKMVISADTFSVGSQTIQLDNVISHSTIGYLGNIKDPETGSYVSGNFIFQMNAMSKNQMPELSKLTNKDIIADSCKMAVMYSTFIGDSTASMKCTLHEMNKPLEENEVYDVHFMPTAENGYLRKDGGIKKSTTYSIVNFVVPDSIRFNPNGYDNSFTMDLNEEYTDTKGNKYNNYGTYLMRKYYENPSDFKTTYNFTHKVCPGFYLEHTAGLGSIANISAVRLYVYTTYKKNDNGVDTTFVSLFESTEEVLQKTNIVQDTQILDDLQSEDDHTYLKTPSGLYTQLSLPVDEIFKGHENDTLNTASVTISRKNNEKEVTDYTLPIPKTILILPADSVETFFANNKVTDSRTSHLAKFAESESNAYIFNNISGMLRPMYNAKKEYLAKNPGVSDEQYEALFPNWNKAVIIPVTVSSTSIGQSSVNTRVTHDMSITSTRLAGGKNNPDAIKISCIYSKYQQK